MKTKHVFGSNEEAITFVVIIKEVLWFTLEMEKTVVSISSLYARFTVRYLTVELASSIFERTFVQQWVMKSCLV